MGYGGRRTIFDTSRGKRTKNRLLKQFGWEVEQEPVSIEEIVIPQQFNQVYERYNELQKTQGMDLTKYAGKTVKKWYIKLQIISGRIPLCMQHC